MGIPAFFRWLSAKYPKIISDVVEERWHYHGGIALPPDGTKPPPSGLHVDNLYIDMNGIIHPCSHPEHGPQPSSEEEMYDNVCRYVDRLFNAVRPRKLLYLAIDGVAPRAKMNQQRARRFRAAQEVRETLEMEQQLAEQLRSEGKPVPPSAGKRPWDSNVITPGTPFMLGLATHLRFYIRKRISENPAWQGIQLIFSDASIPGEGEHKIMAHIRHQRAQPGYDPNTVHVLQGLDADLVMLALATHEAHFYILREEVIFGRKGANQSQHRKEVNGFAHHQRMLDEAAGPEAMDLVENKHKSLQLVSIPILREYLSGEFRGLLGTLPFEPDLERIIDDFVFLCFFVGNDFLPHLPSLDIRDGALDFLINVYKRILPSLGGYLTSDGGHVHLSRIDVILAEVGEIESHVFTMRHTNEQIQEQRKKGSKNRSNPPPPPPTTKLGKSARALHLDQIKEEEKAVAIKRKLSAAQQTRNALKKQKIISPVKSAIITKKEVQDESVKTEELIDKVKLEVEVDQDEIEAAISNVSAKDTNKNSVKDEEDYDQEDDDDDVPEVDDLLDPEFKELTALERAANESEADKEAKKELKELLGKATEKKLDGYKTSIQDNVRLHETGWKDRYYNDKCKAQDIEGAGGREELFKSYIMGLCWVMKYYYGGVCSWKWYFPFHYAPFASDLRNIERFENDCQSFEINTPFSPVEQLMAVLPSDSSHAVPVASRWLMKDDESPIIDFYPTNVICDPNGKAMPWLWVVLLPFIEEDRLLEALTPTKKEWSPREQFCNSRGLDDAYLYIHKSNPLAETLQQVLSDSQGIQRSLGDAARWNGFSGSVRAPLSDERIQLDDIVHPPKRKSRRGIDEFMAPITKNASLCVSFKEPPKRLHRSAMLLGATPPPPTLDHFALSQIQAPNLSHAAATIAQLGKQPFREVLQQQLDARNGFRRHNNTGSLGPPVFQYNSNAMTRFGMTPPTNPAPTFRPAAMQTFGQSPHQLPPPPPPPPHQNTFQPPARGGFTFRANGGRGGPGRGGPGIQANAPGRGGIPVAAPGHGKTPGRGGQGRMAGRGGPMPHNGAGLAGVPSHFAARFQPPPQQIPPPPGPAGRGGFQGRGAPPPAGGPVNSNVMNDLRSQLRNTLKQNHRNKHHPQ